jgi:hypothetical protein
VELNAKDTIKSLLAFGILTKTLNHCSHCGAYHQRSQILAFIVELNIKGLEPLLAKWSLTSKYHQKMSNSLFGLWSLTSEISNHCLHCGV